MSTMTEQANNTESNMFVMTVMSRDRVGIVRDLTAALNGLSGHIEHVNQTVLMNYFTLTLVVSFPQRHDTEKVRELLSSAGLAGEFEIGIKPFEPGVQSKPAVIDADSFILTATGVDRPGLLDQLVNYLAGKGINILDLNVQKGDPEHFLLISQLAVPKQMDISQIRLDIEALSKKLDLAIALQHENIFRATNELTPPSNFFQEGV